MFLLAEEIVNTTLNWRDEPRTRVPIRSLTLPSRWWETPDGVQPPVRGFHERRKRQ